jgi:hypothetical protein
MSRPDQCPLCKSQNYTALNADGSRYNPFLERAEQVRLHGHTLWENFRCEKCRHIWRFNIVHVVEESKAGEPHDTICSA